MDTSLAPRITTFKYRDSYGRVCRDINRDGRTVAVIIRLPKPYVEKYGHGYLVNDLTMPAVPQDAPGKLSYFPASVAGLRAAAAFAARCGR